MRFLFCDNMYPGRFGHLPARLAADPENRVMFLSYHARSGGADDNVAHARFRLDRTENAQESDPFFAAWGKAFRLGRQAFRTFCHIRDSGFVPDMIFITFFDGPALFVRRAFPEAFVTSYFGALRVRDADVASRLDALADVQNHQALQSDLCFVRSEAQKARFAAPLQPRLHVLPPFVDTTFFSPGHGELREFFPDENARELVVFHMKGASRAAAEGAQTALALLAGRPSCCAALAFGNERARDLWRERGAALPERLRQRLLFVGGLDKNDYRALLCAADVHVFPENEDPPLQEMLETMSCETLLMTPEGGRNPLFVPGETVETFPADASMEERARRIAAALDGREESLRIRRRGRSVMERRCNEASVLDEHLRFVLAAFARTRQA
ncbi:glycosyltransferase [uncultured Mailhella sp.]|uniref:glycosyltransferase family protein n=1 Tax=uncultured Mailhella sp. TaxID=1981031 RepID=UPI0032097FE4